MRLWTGLMVGLALVTAAHAQTDVDHRGFAQTWRDADNRQPLPAFLTPEEERLPRPRVPASFRAPPTGQVYCPPEYAPAAGLFIAWEAYETILTEMTVKITQNDPNATVWVVVDSTSERTTATNTLTSAGAVMSRVSFIVRVTDTVWIRDYGPLFIYEDDARNIIDHVYNRPRPNDDAFNDYLATLWGVQQYDIPLIHGGGNFHLFGNGEAFMSSLILDENPGLSAQDVKDLYLAYQNLDLTIYTGFPSSFDSTRHIDMWMFPLGDYKVLIGQYQPATGQPYTISEGAVTDLLGRGYTVYLTPGWKSGAHYTYTNAVILNNQCFISKFGGSYTAQDAQALAVFQSALPGYTIWQINCASIINAAGALHCIVMHVPVMPPPLTPGDMNCDGVVNFDDINPFVLALTDQAGYLAAFPDCYYLNGDCNDDGLVNFDDISPFVALLSPS